MKKNRTFKNFQDWNSIDVQTKLSVAYIESTPLLSKWLSVEAFQLEEVIPTQLLNELRQELRIGLAEWNEAELIFKFIGLLLHSVKFKNSHYNEFLQRKLSAHINDYRVQGVVDYMVATGVYEPEKPYFFLHEYKRFKGTEADPLGQLLIAMLAAQQLNNDGEPIYGCYVFGAIWNFVLLEGNQYSASQGYDARDKQELEIIWKILYQTKLMIEQKVQQTRSPVNAIK
jgi:hypothetical protein